MLFIERPRLKIIRSQNRNRTPLLFSCAGRQPFLYPFQELLRLPGYRIFIYFAAQSGS